MSNIIHIQSISQLHKFMGHAAPKHPAISFIRFSEMDFSMELDFDGASADALRQLLGAVAVYAAGGRMALENRAQKKGGAALRLTDQLFGKR